MITFTESTLNRLADLLGVTDDELADPDRAWPHDIADRVEHLVATRDQEITELAQWAVRRPVPIPEASRQAIQEWINSRNGGYYLRVAGRSAPMRVSGLDWRSPVAPPFPIVELRRQRVQIDPFTTTDQAVRTDTDEVVAEAQWRSIYHGRPVVR